MYNLVKAFGRTTASGARWTEVDIANLMMSTLFSTYEEMFIVLTNPFYEGQRCLNLADIRAKYNTSSLTFSEMLVALGNDTLPTSADIPSISTRYAFYTDARRSQFKVQPVNPNVHPDAEIPPGDKDWLSVTKEGLSEADYHLLFKTSLININGFFHRTDTDGQRLYVIDGMKTCRSSGKDTMGILNFMQLGELEFVSITEDMVHRRNPDQPLGKTMYIDIGVARPNKTAMLVLGGYLHVLDATTFYRVSDTIFAVDFENLPWPQRFFESSKVFDFSFLELETIAQNDKQVSVEELYSDNVLKKYASMSQSFVVFIDNENLFIEREDLGQQRLLNTYTVREEPRHALINGMGKVDNYWRVYEQPFWALTVMNSARDNYVFTTTPELDLVSIDDSRVPNDAVEVGRAQFLKIGSDLKITAGA